MATIMRKMNIISRCEALYRTEKFSCDIPAIYHSYILCICKNPGMPQEALARHLCINKSSVTRHIAFLEKNGYIEKRLSETDKREHLIYPTGKMLASLDEVVNITMEWNSLLADGISTEELKLFHSIMDKMLVRSQELIKGGKED